MKRKHRRTFSIHHWCGLIAGIFILAISLSGSVLVFEGNIDDATYAKQSTLDVPAPLLKIDESFEWIRQKNPGWEIRIPKLSGSGTEALHYELRQGQLRKWIFVHPTTGKEIATIANAHDRLTYVLLNLHYNFLEGTPGKIAVLLTGVAFLFLTITGFLIYKKSILKVLTFKKRISTKNRRSFFNSLHNTIGVWSLMFNLFMCISGLTLAYSVVSKALKGDKKEIATPVIPTSIDAALTDARNTYPHFEIHSIRFPKNEEGKLQFIGRCDSDPFYYGTSYSNLQLDYKTGKIGKEDFLRNHTWYERLLTALHPLHFGDYAGLFVQIVYCIGGLMPGILSISGFIIWYYRSSQKKKGKYVSSYRTT